MKANQKKLSVRERAIGLLARREHSRQELQSKLLIKGFLRDEIDIALDSLEKKGWLSDLRFAESWIRHRIQGCYGQYRIKAELNQKGVSSDIVEQAFVQESTDWFALAKQAWQKKYFGKYHSPPKDWETQSKQKRFLQSRGFSNDEIAAVFNQ